MTPISRACFSTWAPNDPVPFLPLPDARHTILFTVMGWAMRPDTVKKKFVRILQIELEDLIEHLHELIRDYQAKYDSGAETEHVCLENMATLRNEECGVHYFLKLLDTVDVGAFEDLDVLIAGLRERFRKPVQHGGLAPCACVHANREIDKVAAYVRSSGGPACP